jgi:signal transduction histidine kinase
MSVRRVVLILMVVTGVLAVTAAALITVLTDHLSATVASLNSNLEAVRAAQQVEVDLLIHAQASDPLIRTSLENDVLDGLRTVRQYVAGDEETDALDVAKRELAAYFDAVDGTGRTLHAAGVDRALGAVRKVADLNIAKARAAEAEAIRWDRMAERVGIAISLAVIVGVPSIMIWVGIFAFKPMFSVINAMKGLAAGEMNARVATNTGMEELRRVGEQFNDMADVMRRQRENQLAFLAGVAHDLGNPINVLNLSVSVLSDGRPLPSERCLRDMLGIVKRQIQFLNRMVEDLRDAHQIEAGQLAMRPEVCDARALVENACELFRPVLGSHRLKVTVPAGPVPMECDPIRLRQVLNNLVSNAIKYSPRGGEIFIMVDRREKEILLQVRDCGIGIPHEELPHIFEPFRRTKLSKEEIPGTGLGLHVSRRIVESHGGRIEVESEIGKGATFRVYLPTGDAHCSSMNSRSAVRC